MTKREREQVVELLRCAADRNDPFDTVIAPFAITHARLGSYRLVRNRAEEAMRSMFGGKGKDFRRDCLEAALRVELGDWP